MKSLIYFLLILFIIKGVFWVGLIPMWQSPDEPNHFANIQFTAETGKLYVGRGDKNLSAEIAKSAELLNLDLNLNLQKFALAPSWIPNFSQNFVGKFENEIKNIPKETRTNFIAVVGGVKSPPFYYILASLIYRIFANFSLIERIFFVRFFSLILGAGVVWLSFILAKELFSNEKTSLAVATIISFHPTFNVISSTVNPDIMLIFLTSAFLYFGVKILKNNDFSLKNLSFFFVSLISAVLTRFAAFSLILASIVVLAPRRIYLILPLIFLFLGGFLIFFRSPGLFSEFSQFFAVPANLAPVSFLNFATYSFTHYNGEVFSWYWAVFGWLEASLPVNIYRVLRILTVISLFGLIFLIFNWLKKPKVDQGFLVWTFIIVTIFASSAIFVLFDWQTYVRTGIGFGVQGRHFLASISAQMILFTLGIKTIAERFKMTEKYLLLFLTFWFIFLNILSIWVIINFFYQPHDFYQFILRVSQYKPDFFKNIWLIFWLLTFLVFQLIFTVKVLGNFLKNEK